ncbi:class I adenylate-forming enzyme family protein [Actinomadura sp. LOL_016]|uniref:class I adenylate-forming enzyme family protein n=1 Tax=unclassified Actinomadura TaxID=2626254 RepID=UPI003A8038FF
MADAGPAGPVIPARVSPVVDAGDGLPLTVPALLRDRAAARGGHRLLVCDREELTYADAEHRSAALARGLLAAGAGKGTHVGLLYPNGADFVVGWLAAARIGAVTIPFSTFSTATELRGLLRGADVEILLAADAFRSHDYLATLREAVPELDLGTPPPLRSPTVPALRRIAFQDGTGVPAAWSVAALIEAGTETPDEPAAASEADVSPADRMVIVHTSGSTGDPKGAVHRHGPLIRHMANLNVLRRVGETDVHFSNSPFFWVGGFAFSLLGTVLAGATLVCSNSADSGEVLDLIERTRPTLAFGFAASVAHLAADPSFARRDLRSFRRGNLWPILPDGVRAADPGLRHNMLGTTETGSVCLLSEDESDQPEHRRGSFGRPAPGFEAEVVDPETGAACRPGDIGELRLRGPFLMEGYYGREYADAFDADGWYRTGDLFTTDEDGFHYFQGRRGEMIKTAGANVSPREVEAAFLDASGLTAHVVGVDDPVRGQIVAAAVRVPPGRTPVDPDELKSRLRSRLSAYKVPRRIVLMGDDEVPMMSSGKLDLRALKSLLAAGSAPRG